MGGPLVKRSRYSLAKTTRSRSSRTIARRREAKRKAKVDRKRWRPGPKPQTIRSDVWYDDPHLIWLAARDPIHFIAYLGQSRRLSAALSALALAREEIEALRSNPPHR